MFSLSGCNRERRQSRPRALNGWMTGVFVISYESTLQLNEQGTGSCALFWRRPVAPPTLLLFCPVALGSFLAPCILACRSAMPWSSWPFCTRVDLDCWRAPSAVPVWEDFPHYAVCSTMDCRALTRHLALIFPLSPLATPFFPLGVPRLYIAYAW